MKFRKVLANLSYEKRSRVIVALDLQNSNVANLLDRAIGILDQISDKIVAVKLNHHLILPFGIAGLRPLLKRCKRAGLPCIADLKLGDIGDTNRVAAELLFDNGFEAIIASPLPGIEAGLAPLLDAAKSRERGIFLLVYMSHRGADEIFGAQLESGERLYQKFIQIAKTLSVDGVVVGATKPEIIREAKTSLGSGKLVISPGVGVQGGREDVAKHGADYVIVGRSVVNASRPDLAVERIRKANWAGSYRAR